MRSNRPGRLVLLAIVAALALAACQQAKGPATSEEIALGAMAEEARGHLASALGDGRAGRWELAAVHAAHPGETMQAVDSALAKRDAKAAGALRQGADDVVRAAQAKDLARLERAVADLDARYAGVAPTVLGADRAADLSYRASVVASLGQAGAAEYGEAVVNGKLAEVAEYQDAYAFLARARALWSEIEPAVAAKGGDERDNVVAAFAALDAALPGLEPPASAKSADEVAALTNTVHEELRDAVGAQTGVAAAGASELKALTKQLDGARDALAAGNVAAAQEGYRGFKAGWAAIEDGIRARSRDGYVAIEDRIRGVDAALMQPASPDAKRADAAIAALDETIDDALPAVAAGQPGGAPAAGATFQSANARLDAALAALDRGDTAAAATEVKAFRDVWPDVEGAVKARSPEAYGAIEDDTAAALARLSARPADAAGARLAVEAIRTRLEPFVTAPTTYGAFDAAVILLREGLEALLVVAALLAFLVQSGNADKRGWIWAGGGAGVLASVAVAIVVNVAFSASASTGLNPEILEGVTGLFAAAMLVYVSYWMHSKASLSTWQRYIREKTSSALARNSLLSLALIAFLAVFREGGETVLFYLGIAPSIALSQLLLGLGIGAAGLGAIGFAMIVLGVRIPVRPFFLVASLLIYYLAFKFVGAGIHALQVAGIVPSTPSGTLPGVGLIGMYPTWETTAVQVALLAAAVGFVLWERLRSASSAVLAR